MSSQRLDKIYVGDIGLKIRLDSQADLSGAAVQKILYRKPGDLTEYEWSATIEENRYVCYTVVEDDLDTAGEWLLQAYVETSTWEGRGETVRMTVYDIFK